MKKLKELAIISKELNDNYTQIPLDDWKTECGGVAKEFYSQLDQVPTTHVPDITSLIARSVVFLKPDETLKVCEKLWSIVLTTSDETCKQSYSSIIGVLIPRLGYDRVKKALPISSIDMSGKYPTQMVDVIRYLKNGPSRF